MMKTYATRHALLITLFCGCGCILCTPPSVVLGQSEKQDDPPPAKQQQEQQQDDDNTEKSLDELLGLDESGDGDSKGDATGGLPDVADELNPETKPAGPPISQLLQEAMKAMGLSATRLMTQHDPGLVTQRHQEDAILRLDMLIKQAQKKQKKKQDGKQEQSKNKSKPSDPKDQQQQQKSGQQPGDQASQSQDSLPAGQSQDLEGNISESRLEWGSLPARIRDLLTQGKSDSPASLYRRLTEQYYKRLAEEAEQDN